MCLNASLDHSTSHLAGSCWASAPSHSTVPRKGSQMIHGVELNSYTNPALRGFRPPWDHLKTTTHLWGTAAASGNRGESRKRGYADFPAPWSASRKGSASMECVLSQQHPLCLQQNRFNRGHCAEVVVRCVQTHTPTWSSSQQLQMTLTQHLGVSVLQKQRQPCWFVIIAWVF